MRGNIFLPSGGGTLRSDFDHLNMLPNLITEDFFPIVLISDHTQDAFSFFQR